MKALKTILGAVYVILILLLLLTNRNCQGYGSQNGGSGAGNGIEEIQPGQGTLPGAQPEPNDTTGMVRQARETGNSGNLKVTLLWSFQGDIDLHITQPNGVTICHSKAKDPDTGGFLDVDNLAGGENSAENIYWENPEKGKYKVKLVYYQASKKTKIAESGICTVVVFQEGKSPQTYEVPMNNVKDQKNVVNVIIE